MLIFLKICSFITFNYLYNIFSSNTFILEAAKIQNDNYTGPYIASNLDVALTISCRATGKPEPYVTWIKDGFYLDNGNFFFLLICN